MFKGFPKVYGRCSCVESNCLWGGIVVFHTCSCPTPTPIRLWWCTLVVKLQFFVKLLFFLVLFCLASPSKMFCLDLICTFFSDSDLHAIYSLLFIFLLGLCSSQNLSDLCVFLCLLFSHELLYSDCFVVLHKKNTYNFSSRNFIAGHWCKCIACTNINTSCEVCQEKRRLRSQITSQS